MVPGYQSDRCFPLLVQHEDGTRQEIRDANERSVPRAVRFQLFFSVFLSPSHKEERHNTILFQKQRGTKM